MPQQYALMAELEAAFDQLDALTATLCDHLERHPPLIWQRQSSAPLTPVEWLRHALTDFWYEDGQDGRVTRNYIGVVAADPALMAHVHAVNAAKDDFGTLIGRVKEAHPDQLSTMKASLPTRSRLLNEHLKADGLIRLHLKQCWRRIPTVEDPVARVRLAWYTSGRSIKRLSVADAEALLLKMDTAAPHIQIQYRQLAALPSDEVLAQVQLQAPVMRANLFYTEPLDDGRTRQAMNIALPLFVPDHAHRLPHINQPPEHPPATRTRAKRRDTRLEDDPYLPSLRVYRYR